MSNEEQAIWRRLLGVQARLMDRLDDELRQSHDLSLAEYECLLHLSESGPAGIRMSDLAGRLFLSRSGLTRRIDAMVRADLVERTSCASDGRGSFARLTDAGAERLAQAAPTHIAGVRRYLIDTFEGDLPGLSDALKRIEAELGYTEADLPGTNCGQPGE